MSFSKNESQELLRLYKHLRVSDVSDGMDRMMMHEAGLMSPRIRPLYRTRAVGIARTCRYLPFGGPIPKMDPREYADWTSWYYGNVCTYFWMGEIEEGDFCVIDQSEVDAGLMGSNNSLGGMKTGARGFITNGGVRDTDELVLEKVPFWSLFVSKSTVHGRLKFDDMNVPIAVGGVLVNPGDVIVADGDGVVVVPRDMAGEVAECACQEMENDRASRRQLHVDMGMPLDETVSTTV
jgi:regulator of RNase E activity RraA